jgi:CxxC-x17-CxxC domain-containing protein
MHTMGDFNRGRGSRDNKRFGGGRDFSQSRSSFDRPRFGGGRDSGGRESSGNREMFKAICANCGKECQVPFRPREDKPVYCSDCFEQKGGRDTRSGGQNRFDRPQFNENRQTPTANPNQYKQDFEMLNAKLDKIMRLLIPVETPKPVAEAATMIEEPVKAPKKKLVKKTSKKA